MDFELDHFKNIRFGSRKIRARAKQIYSNQSVFHLTLPAHPILDRLLSWIPGPIHRLLKHIFPEWFLPSTIILKESNSDRHRNELKIYRQLEPLQGKYVPHCFGEAISDNGISALILECIEGTPLHQLTLEDLANDEILEGLGHGTLPRAYNDVRELINPHLLSALEEMYFQLTKHGVVHGDPELHNFIKFGGGVVAIDFEFSHLVPDDDYLTNEHGLETLLDHMKGVIDPNEIIVFADMGRSHGETSMDAWFGQHRSNKGLGLGVGQHKGL